MKRIRLLNKLSSWLACVFILTLAVIAVNQPQNVSAIGGAAGTAPGTGTGGTPSTNGSSADGDGSWCNASSTDSNTSQCHADNVKKLDSITNISDEQKSSAHYDDVVTKCAESNGAGQGACGNAYVTCLQLTITSANCDKPDYLSAIAERCNDGKQEDTKNADTCGPIYTANDQSLQAEADTVTKSANAACVPAGTSQADSRTQQAACDKVLKDATDSCNTQFGNERYGGTISRVNTADYQKCIQDKVKSSDIANNNAAFCGSVGGIYTDEFKDPVPNPDGTPGNSNVSKGCKGLYSDLINKPACDKAGGTWTQTGGQNTPTNTKDDAYGCNPPAGKNNDGSDIAKDGGANEPGLTGNFGTKTCDGVATNLIADCKGSGVSVLGDILKIGITVLTMLVGIAAVGGLTWEALQYARAQDDSSIVSNARNRILEIIIGLIIYGLMIAIINWLVPGAIGT